MKDFFKGWKRKTGVATLLMACVFAAGWVRSTYLSDIALFPCLGRQQVIYVKNGRIRWMGSPRSVTNLRWFHLSGRHANQTVLNLIISELEIRDPNAVGKDRSWEVPYWPIVLPLTVLSTYLMFSKQPAKQTKDRP